MPLKATCIDENRTNHLLIGLNREDVERLMAGGRLTFEVGSTLGPNSQIQICFAETDEDLIADLPPQVEPGMGQPS